MPQHARTAWLKTLGLLVGVLAVALVIGLLVGQAWPSLTLAALALIAWHYWKLRHLLLQLSARRRFMAPRGDYVWSELERLLHRNQHETQGRKRRLLDMLRAYRAVADALPDAVVVVQRDTQRIAWFNAAATGLLGLQHPQDVDAALAELLQPLPIARWLTAGRNAEPLMDVASPVDPDRRLSLRLIPYSDALWLLVARDVSRLMQLEHMRRDFVANVSHELRTPLTVVHGYLDMLDADQHPGEHPDWPSMLAEMQRQSQRMAQLVEDLLTLSRLEAKDGINDESIAMTSMLSTLKREAEALSQHKHTISIEDSAQVDLWGSTHELHSAFSNLVSNAVRYTPTGGTIGIRFTRDPDGGATLSVRDSGYGIPEAHLSRITERFYRVSTSRSRESGGTGLGLAIAKHALGLHQARLGIVSEVGRGSVFSCHFSSGRIHTRDSTKHDSSKHDSTRHDSTRHVSTRHVSRKHDSSKRDSSSYPSSKNEPSDRSVT